MPEPSKTDRARLTLALALVYEARGLIEPNHSRALVESLVRIENELIALGARTEHDLAILAEG